MIVVPVLMTSCQVSENPNTGPLTAHTTINKQHNTKVAGLPVVRATEFANCVKMCTKPPLREPFLLFAFFAVLEAEALRLLMDGARKIRT